MRMSKTSLGLILAVVMGSGATSTDARTQPVAASDRARPASQPTAPTRQTVTVEGRVLDRKQVPIRGRAGAHEVVSLATEDGRRVIADLGPAGGLKDLLPIRPGTTLSIEGYRRRVGSQGVVFARQLTVGGRSIEVRQHWEELDRRNPARLNQPVKLTGRIGREKTVRIAGSDRSHKVVLLATPLGTFPVDLGPAPALPGETLREGARMTVEGRLVAIGDRVVLWADHVRHRGRRLEVQRPTEGS